MKEIDFYFDFISPYSYLAAIQLQKFKTEHDVIIHWIPINLPKLISVSGNTPPSSVKNKAMYSLRDLKRWAEHLDVPFKMIRPGSFDSRPAMHIADALDESEKAVFCRALFEAIWSGDVDMHQDDWLIEVFRLKKLPQAWLSKQQGNLDKNTNKAYKAGAFGTPTFILHGEGRPQMFFGVDRMGFLSRACQR